MPNFRLQPARSRAWVPSSFYRCLSCHQIRGWGGELSTVPLDRIGSQLQRAYLVSYLQTPGAVRVSLEERMPHFHMTALEAETLADHLATVFVDDTLERPFVPGAGLARHGAPSQGGLDRSVAVRPPNVEARHAAAELPPEARRGACVDGLPDDALDGRCGEAPMNHVTRRAAVGLASLATVLAVVGCRRGPAAAQADPLMDVFRRQAQEEGLTRVGTEGKRLFVHYCATCHGEKGEGDGQNAFNLDPKVPNFGESRRAHPPSYWRQVIEGGSAAVGRSSQCPPWGGSLGATDIDALIAYLSLLTVSSGRQVPSEPASGKS